ncbi:hypothetical protein GCM10023238_22780 [Streptomyces heliomycini]
MRPVSSSKVLVSPEKLICGSSRVPPSSAKSRAPGADMLKYSPFRPCTTTSASAAVEPADTAAVGTAADARGVRAPVDRARAVTVSRAHDLDPGRMSCLVIEPFLAQRAWGQDETEMAVGSADLSFQRWKSGVQRNDNTPPDDCPGFAHS